MKRKSKRLQRGKFYWHRDSSEPGLHPSKIYKKKVKKNKYYAVCFTGSPGRGRKLLNQNIDPCSKEKCYVKKTPVVEPARKFGKEIGRMRVTDKRDKAIIRRIQKKK